MARNLETTTKIMSSIHSKNTKPELQVRKMLYQSGIRGYRVNFKNLPGSPDICFTRWKLAIFINGCFWHRCPKCNLDLPRTNTDYWKTKFNNNIERDERNINELESLGWTVITIWECEIKENLQICTKKIADTIMGLTRESE